MLTTILLIDDERMICKLFARTLEQAGYRVATAHSGEEGLRLFQQEHPTLTLLDLHMPEMDGITVLRQLRALAPTVPVIVLTGFSDPKSETEARRLGVTDFLRKNLDLDVILQRIQCITKGSVGKDPAEDDGTTRILIAEDDEGIAKMVRTFVAKLGYQVHTAGDGKEALQMIDQLRPHLLLLDLYMPETNGIEVLRTLSAKKSTPGVILMSGEGNAHLIQEALALGAFDYLAKPLDLDRLAVSVRAKLALMQHAQRPGWKQWFKKAPPGKKLS